jgi:hypothetical protein
MANLPNPAIISWTGNRPEAVDPAVPAIPRALRLAMELLNQINGFKIQWPDQEPIPVLMGPMHPASQHWRMRHSLFPPGPTDEQQWVQFQPCPLCNPLPFQTAENATLVLIAATEYDRLAHQADLLREWGLEVLEEGTQLVSSEDEDADEGGEDPPTDDSS